MKWFKCLKCRNTEVEEINVLDFSCNSLREVPAIVFNYERTLESLYLDYNKIIELPRTLFHCEELRYLGLSDNEIETIPPLIEKLSNLENLLLSRNCLVYESIPSNIHRCQRLRFLHLSSNSLTRVPGSIMRLIALKELYLNNCDLEFLPANFGRLHNLRILELRENHLSNLPKSLKRLSDLRRLDISGNMFKEFPDVIGTMTNLAELWLNDNFITEIPECIGNLHKLTHFDISCNRIATVAESIGNCGCMTLLSLSMNDIQELPHTVGNLYALHTLKVDHNLLKNLPPEIGKLQNLEELDIQYNNLKSFPTSIGMLRKLISLVASQNSIAFLPIEIGSCSSLSILSLHNNCLVYLPEEIGHLQKLTSISLINNKLRYLPLTILSLRKLKALWLSHNQNQPLITLQKDIIENGRAILTCIFLPQVEVPLQIKEEIPEIVVPSARKINFADVSVSNSELPPTKLNRIPTPHPKAFVKYRRALDAGGKKCQKSVPQNMENVYVKAASIIATKNSADECLPPEITISIDNKNEDYVKFSSISDQFIEQTETFDQQKPTEIVLNDDDVSNSVKPKQPPPYHIAAAYSKDAHRFVNGFKYDQGPKHFTQDQPSNILNPQPKHPNCVINTQSSETDIRPSNDYLHKTAETHTSGWIFGNHKNRKILKVELTPCCYVLGFKVDHNDDGVFVSEVDKNGNAFQKLCVGDKILMLDDKDISKMNPKDALKSVQMWGPETEVFLISRN